ncbi:MAG: penicillin-binding protein 1C [Alcaligenaceae bacterium]|nr:penicillin-binding protein 1C [Alcaligenaceae bacterium]
MPTQPFAQSLPDYPAVRAAHRPSSVQILDRQGVALDQFRTDFHRRRGQWVELNAISPALQRAVLLSEDRHFHEHAGVDWSAIAAAGWGQLVSGTSRGASTLSMQLAGMLDTSLAPGAGGRSVLQKVDQILQARALEARWSKDQILEAYLNLTPFRGELVGVNAVSRVLFRKHPSGLNAPEAALAAALLRGPNAPAPVLERRACEVLLAMGSSAQCSALRSLVSLAVQRTGASWADAPGDAPHVAGLLRSLGYTLPPSGVVRVSLDAGLQRQAQASLQRQLAVLTRANVNDGAIVVLDNRTGQVLAYVGSSGDYSSAHRVDHARALRQAGSTLKPFLYAQAIEQERLTAASLIHDSPLGLPGGGGIYQPRNYDEHFSGWVSTRTALASSLNIPAVRTLVQVTPDAFAARLVQLGLPLTREGEFYGYSLALGSADVTLLSLTNAYRTLANLGEHGPVTVLPDNEPSVGNAHGSGLLGGRAPKPSGTTQQVFDAGAAWIIGHILADRLARSPAFGLDSPLSTPFWSAVKTGTSKDMRDNWCVGWSRFYTVGVWVGNSQGASMQNVSGVSGACPVWHELMQSMQGRLTGGAAGASPGAADEAGSAASAHAFAGAPLPPVNVSARIVSYQPVLEASRQEFFLGDTAQDLFVLETGGSLIAEGPQASWPFEPCCSGPPAAMLRIASPLDGTVYALDPDIPVSSQHLWLRARGDRAGQAVWRVNGRIIGQGDQVWQPVPGRHAIELINTEGEVLDRVVVQVRG